MSFANHIPFRASLTLIRPIIRSVSNTSCNLGTAAKISGPCLGGVDPLRLAVVPLNTRRQFENLVPKVADFHYMYPHSTSGRSVIIIHGKTGGEFLPADNVRSTLPTPGVIRGYPR